MGVRKDAMGVRVWDISYAFTPFCLGDRDMADEYRSFNGEIRNLVKRNEFVYEVELWLLNDIPNRNGWQYTNMAGNKDQFAGTPILIAVPFAVRFLSLSVVVLSTSSLKAPACFIFIL